MDIISIPYTKLRRELKQWHRRVANGEIEVIITRCNKPVARFTPFSSKWDEWFDGPAASDDFMEERYDSFRKNLESQSQLNPKRPGQFIEALAEMPASIAILGASKMTTKFIDPKEVHASVEQARSSGKLSGMVSKARIRYQASPKHPGMLEQIHADGTRVTGNFAEGVFTPIETTSKQGE